MVSQILIVIFVSLFLLLFIGVALRAALISFLHKATGKSMREFINGTIEDDRPKSVSGGDNLFLPRILKDFPDFSLITAKEEVRKRIEQEMISLEDLKIHKISISDYRRAGFESEIVFQCAFEITMNDRREQKRYCLHYVFSVKEGSAYVGMTCSNCGAPIKTTMATHCEYCGCRLINITGASWDFTQVYEK